MAWLNDGELERELRERNVPIMGCAVGLKQTESTQFAATFVLCDGDYVRLDWSRKPTHEEKKAAVAVIRQNCTAGTNVAPIESDSTVYPPPGLPEPMQLWPVLCYYWPRIWLGWPGVSHSGIDLTFLHHVVYKADITQGIRVKVYRIGLFAFDFSNWTQDAKAPTPGLNQIDRLIERKMRRISVLNAHMICLCDAVARAQHKRPSDRILPKTLIAPVNTIWAPDFADPLSNKQGGAEAPLIEAVPYGPDFEATQGRDVSHAIQAKFLMQHRSVVSEEALKRSFDKLAAVLDHSSDPLPLIEILAHACKAFEDNNYNLALIAAWAVIEQMIQTRWRRYIKDERGALENIGGQQVPRINKDRANKLEGNDFTASIITEFLTCLGLLPFELYKPLDQVRKARNDWMHKLQPVTRDAASQAVALARTMLRQVEGFDLEIPVWTHL